MSLQDDQWLKIRDFLKSDSHAYVGKNEEECRRFFESVLWVSRSGAKWRLSCLLSLLFTQRRRSAGNLSLYARAGEGLSSLYPPMDKVIRPPLFRLIEQTHALAAEGEIHDAGLRLPGGVADDGNRMASVYSTQRPANQILT